MEALLHVLFKFFCCQNLEEWLFVRFIGTKAFVLERTYTPFNI
jgi:hypothetical protein